MNRGTNIFRWGRTFTTLLVLILSEILKSLLKLLAEVTCQISYRDISDAYSIVICQSVIIGSSTVRYPRITNSGDSGSLILWARGKEYNLSRFNEVGVFTVSVSSRHYKCQKLYTNMISGWKIWHKKMLKLWPNRYSIKKKTLVLIYLYIVNFNKAALSFYPFATP